MYGDMLSNVGAAEKVFSYLDRRPNLPQTGTLAPPRLEGRVEFQNVFFSYPSRPDKPVLQVSEETPWGGVWSARSAAAVRHRSLHIIFSRKLP